MLSQVHMPFAMPSKLLVTIAKCIREQAKANIIRGRLSVKEHGVRSSGAGAVSLTCSPRVKLQCCLNEVRPAPLDIYLRPECRDLRTCLPARGES